MDTNSSTNKTRTVSLLAIAALIGASFLTMGLGPMGVVTIKVSSAADVLADDGVCTLREAIIAANTNSPSGEQEGECPAGQDSKQDIITLSNGVTYSLTINSTAEDAAFDGDLDVWDNTADTDLIIGVDGDGTATISQDAAVDDRVFDILAATVNIKGLTLTGGNLIDSGGGGIQNTGTLTISSSTISGNSSALFGGGIANWGGTVKIDTSTISDNNGQGAGGGILNSGTMKLNTTTISGNTSPEGGGGGIWNNGTLKVAATTFANNVAGGGGGLFNEDGVANISDNTQFIGNTGYNGGGGIVNVGSGTLSVDDSLISSNTTSNVGGGLQNEGTGSAVIQNGSEFIGNSAAIAGGGMWSSGTLTVDRITVSNNSATYGGGIVNRPNAMLTVTASTITVNVANEQGGGIVNRADGTALVDSSVMSGNTTDGAGGALFNEGTLTVQNSSEVSGNTADWSGGGIFNAHGGTFSINASTVSGNTVTNDGGGGIMNEGSLTVTNSTILANTANHDGGGIANIGTLIVDASTISANSGHGGGGLTNWPSGTATIKNGSVIGGDPNAGEGNTATGSGGGGVINFGMLTVDGSNVSGNSAPYGGGLNNWAGTITLTNSVVADNVASEQGGGIHNTGFATTVIENGSVISGNTSKWNGGGLANWDDGTVSISNSTVSNNITGGAGGGLSNQHRGTLTIEASTISNNSAHDSEYSSGGGIVNWGATVTLINSTVSENTSPWGGGVMTYGGTLTLDATTVSGNTADNDAGGIFVKDLATVNIINGSQIIENTAAWGGGISSWGSTLTVDASVISNNSVTNSGGGLLIHDSGTAAIQNGSVISGNTATYEGGISNWGGSTLTIDGSVISNNTASGSGGGIGNLGTMTVTGSALLGNTADGEGDAIFSNSNEENATSVTGSCIVGNGDTAVFNPWSVSQNFTGNWWGAASGPSGVGPGSGDSVGDNVDFASWLTMPPGLCPTLWVAAYTYDAGTWTEGMHTYHFEATWNGGSETTDEIFFNVSTEAQPYDGYVLLRPWAVRAGPDCAAIDAILHSQPTRFLAGYVTDYPMTYSEALAYFDSLSASAVWDDGQSAELGRYEIMPFNSDDWFQYVCTFTSP